MFRLGCCVDVEDIETVCKAGYDFVDLSGKELVEMSMKEVEDIKALLRQHNVPCIGIHATFPASVALCGSRYDECIYDEYVEKLAERAEVLGIQYVGVGSPYSRCLENGISKETAEKQLVRCLEKLCQKLPNLMILLESLNCEETNFINTMPEAHDVIKKVTEKNIGLVWDVYHFLKMQENIKDLSEELLEAVKYIHVADANGRGYPLEKTDADFFSLLKTAVEITKVENVAIEAVSTSIEKDIQESREIVFSKMM